MSKFLKQQNCVLDALSILNKTLIFCLFALAFNRLLMPVTPFIGPDAVGYLGPVLRFFTTGDFFGIAERSYVYPLILKLAIEHSHTTQSIVIFQRIFFILGVALLYISLSNSNLWKPLKSRFIGAAIKPLIALICIFFLTQFWQEFIEQWCAPEGVTFGLMAILLYTSIDICLEDNGKFAKKVLIFLIFGLASYALITMQPRYFIPIILLNLIIFLKIYRLYQISKTKLIFLLILVIQYVLLSSFMYKNYSNRDAVSNTRAATFFYYNLNSLESTLKSNIENGKFSQLEVASANDILTTYQQSKNNNIRSYSSGTPPSIGYNTDYMMAAHIRTLQRHSYDFKKVTKFYLGIIKSAGINFYTGLIERLAKEFYYYILSANFFRVAPYNQYKIYWQNSLSTLESFPAEILDNPYTQQLKYNFTSSASIDYLNSSITDKFLGYFFTIVNILFIPIIILALFLGRINSDPFREWKSIRYIWISLISLLLCSLLNVSLGASLYYERYVYDMLLLNGLVFSLSTLRVVCALRNILRGWGSA